MKDHNADKVLDVLAEKIRELEVDNFLIREDNKRLKAELEAEREKRGGNG